MTIPEAMHALLSAALPGVPVLLPEEASTPANYAPLAPDGLPLAGGERGLTAYLAAHPQGYVQIEEPQPISSDGLTDLYWVPVASLAHDQATCAALARTVDLTLNGPPGEPGPHARVFGDQPRRHPAGFFMARPTYDALTIGGTPATQE